MLTRFLLFLIPLSMVSAQQIEATITEKKKRLLVLASDESSAEDAIERKVSKIVSEVASTLGRYEVINRNNLESILEELALHQAGFIEGKDIIELGGISSAKEAMKVEISLFSQRGVPPEDKKDDDDRGFLEMVIYESVKGAIRAATTPMGEELYANNMETIIHGNIILLNVETGETIVTYPITGAHTGGSRGKSLGIALDVIRKSILRSLKEMYIIQSKILEVEGNKVTVFLGSELGVKKGTIYEISRLDKKRTIGDREITIPGRTVGLARINRTSGDASMGTIIRKWGQIKPGYQAKEMLDPPMGSLGLTLRYNVEEERIDHANFLIQIHPLNKFGGFVNIGGGSTYDSRNDRDGIFLFGGGFIYRFLYTPQFNLGAVVDLPLSYIFREDDSGHSVKSLFFSPQVGLQTEIMINRKIDLVIRGGISSAGSTSKWTYTEGTGEDAVSYDAEWDERGAPHFNAAGYYINVSLRFLNINIDH